MGLIRRGVGWKVVDGGGRTGVLWTVRVWLGEDWRGRWGEVSRVADSVGRAGMLFDQ